MAIKIGIAPDSWGVWFPASDPNNAKQPQWWRCLDEMKVAGYEGCEIGPWGYMPNDDPKVLKNAMDARGLTLVGATEGGNFLDDAAVEGMLKDIDDISKLLKAFPSAKYIVLLPPMYTNLATGELEMNPELTDEEWSALPARAPDVTTEDRHVLRAALSLLSEQERQVVMLHAVTGLKHREIAQLLELPLATVLSKYRRALKKLNLLLEGDDA